MTDAVIQQNADLKSGNGVASVTPVSSRSDINHKDRARFKVDLSHSIEKQQATSNADIKSDAKDSGAVAKSKAQSEHSDDNKHPELLPDGKELPTIGNLESDDQADASELVAELNGDRQALLDIVQLLPHVDNNKAVQIVSSDAGSTDPRLNNSSDLIRVLNQKANMGQEIQVTLQQLGIGREQNGPANSDLIMRQNELLKHALPASTVLGAGAQRLSSEPMDGLLPSASQYFKQYIVAKQSQATMAKVGLSREQGKQPLLFSEIEPTAIQSSTLKTIAEITTPGTTTLQMLSHPQQPGWSKELGQRMVWLVQSNIQQAQLQLNPRHLGPMEVQISVNQDQQVSITFTANNAVVKEALDSALPKLREMLDEQGLDLNDVNVADRSQQQAEQQANSKASKLHREEGTMTSDGATEQAEISHYGTMQLSDGAIDFFA